MNPKLAKQIVKLTASLAFSALIGATYKLGKKVDERIDEYYAVEPENDQDD